MHRKMPKKMTAAAMIFFMLLLTFMTGCAGETKGTEELIELTETGSEEVPEERADQKDRPVQEEALGEDPADSREPEAVCVHVCGEVASPGVYTLPAGSRLYEAIEAAGGILESGAGEQLNQAAQIGDGQQIYVPSREEVRQGMMSGAAAQDTAGGGDAAGGRMPDGRCYPAQDTAADDGKVNLNTASREQLMTLSGIGEAKAAAIIAYREEHGGFRKIEELMEVEGIKEGVFNKVKDQIRID